MEKGRGDGVLPVNGSVGLVSSDCGEARPANVSTGGVSMVSVSTDVGQSLLSPGTSLAVSIHQETPLLWVGDEVPRFSSQGVAEYVSVGGVCPAKTSAGHELRSAGTGVSKRRGVGHFSNDDVCTGEDVLLGQPEIPLVAPIPQDFTYGYTASLGFSDCGPSVPGSTRQSCTARIPAVHSGPLILDFAKGAVTPLSEVVSMGLSAESCDADQHSAVVVTSHPVLHEQGPCRKRRARGNADPKANCNSPGSACYDPRFIGGDGIVFYFHGKVNEHFTLFSDTNLQINGRFIGHRPTGRARDFTWIQALGLLFNSHTFSLEATKSATWDQEIDHLKFTYDGQTISLPLGGLSTWKSPDNEIKIERTSSVNSVMVIIPGVVEILANVVPVTAEDDKIHGYNVPSDDCFAHLEVQFRFSGLSDNVEGVLGRTYQPDFKNPAKPGVAMAVVGGEDKYKTSGLLSSDCAKCIFDSGNVGVIAKEVISLDCSAKGFFHGNGIVCKK